MWDHESLIRIYETTADKRISFYALYFAGYDMGLVSDCEDELEALGDAMANAILACK